MYKVSIIIPCFNAEKWIEKSILSALHQDYENFEVIFCDNESTDKSLKIATNLKDIGGYSFKIESAPNIYKYSWEEPVMKALSVSTGDYFTILGADDYMEKSYVSNFMKFITKAPDKIKLFQSPIRGINELDIFLGDISHKYQNLKEFKTLLTQKCPVNTPTVVYSMSLYREGLIKWDSERWMGANDYNLYFELADKDLFIFPYDKWLGYYYRWHKGQSTWGMQLEEKKYDEEMRRYWKEKWKI